MSELYQNEQEHEPRPYNGRPINCKHYGPGVTVSPMMAYKHKYNDGDAICQGCGYKCVAKLRR
jgi:hypothetical protein